MMERLEKVELIREKTGVSYDDAQAALAANNDDVLDAIVWLERLGKVEERTAHHTTKTEAAGEVSPEMMAAQQSYERSSQKNAIGQWLEGVLSEIARLLKRSFDTTFVVERKGEQLIAFPVFILIMLILAWGAGIPLLILGLFMGCHYHFEGLQPISVDVNNMMDKASAGAESLKESFKKDGEQH